MTIRRHRFLIVVIVLGLLFCGSVLQSYAYSVAVIPIADLTHDRDGVNFIMTEQFIKSLKNQGLDVIDQNQVIAFMIAEKIRRCDQIDSFSARKMAAHLHCDTIVQTTVYSHEKRADQSSIIVTLLHGKTGQTIWSKTVVGHLNDSQPIFGIKSTNKLSALQNEQLAVLAKQLTQHPPLLGPLPDLPEIQIRDIRVNPPLVQGGKSVECRIKINFLNEPPDNIVLHGGEQSTTLRPTETSNVFAATLTSKVADGDHDINVSLHWPTGKQTDIPGIETYRVANTPVQLSLSFYNSIKIGDTYAFSEDIKIHPRIKPQRPLELWRIIIRNNQGEIVFSETQYTALPDEMLWRGINKNQRQLETGYYTLTLTVRDIAGNETRANAKLYLQAKTAEMVEVKQRRERGRQQLELSSKEIVLIPVDHWRLTLETPEGIQLLIRKGVQLPATIPLPPRLTRNDIVCHFTMQDKLGNSYSTETVQREIKKGDGAVAHILKKAHHWKADF